MSNKLQAARGTQDFLPEQSELYRHIENIAWETVSLYGYREIATPIFEFSEVFHRTLGEASDALTKETYDFLDRGGESLTLRPEGTAGVVRAFISHGMAQDLPLKFYYSGPMFRYERPQKGRYRQFHQIGVEALGYSSPSADVEAIASAWHILDRLGLSGKTQVEINSLGDRESRSRHLTDFLEYLRPHQQELSSDSQNRLIRNPLRILDSKDEQDKKILADAPKLQDYLNDKSKKFFDSVLNGLSLLGIDVLLNSQLVRGFDYYTHTVFEMTTTHLGSQGAVISGGRYDGLVEQLGGPSTPGVGWGGGLERMMLMAGSLSRETTAKPLVIVPADESCQGYAIQLSFQLRQKGFCVEFLDYGNMGKNLKRANKVKAKYVLIIGENERQKQTVAVKDLHTGIQQEIPVSGLEGWLSSSIF